MPSVPVSSDFVTIATNAGVFLAAVGTVIAAIWTAVKKIKSVSGDESKLPGAKLMGGAILDNTTMVMWSESNRDVAEAMRDGITALHAHRDEMKELRFAMIQLKDKL